MLLKYFILGYLDYHHVVMHIPGVLFVEVLVYSFVLYVAVVQRQQGVSQNFLSSSQYGFHCHCSTLDYRV
jgi:hypothetical protein